MGYDVYITRKKSWFEETGPAITKEEWLAYAASDRGLRVESAGKTHCVILNIQCAYPDPWLDWRDGNIYTKNPDDAIRTRMVQIAAALGAKVQGDDGEIYRSGKHDDYYHEK
jgi:hypothetical protein